MNNTTLKRLISHKVSGDLQESLASARKKYPKSVDHFIKDDPSKTYKYIEWMCKTKEKTPRFYGSVAQIISVVKAWDDLMQRKAIPKNKRDINQLKYDEVVQIINDNVGQLSKTQMKRRKVVRGQKLTYPDREDTEGVYENADWLVVIPYSQEASEELGKMSSWCISNPGSEGNQFWPYVQIDYHENILNPFYFILSKYANEEGKPEIFAIRMKANSLEGLQVFNREDSSRVMAPSKTNFFNETTDPWINIYTHINSSGEKDLIEVEVPYRVIQPLTLEQMQNYWVYIDRNEKECVECKGSGEIPCEACEGAGDVPCEICDGVGTWECPECEGNGFMECPECSGTGDETCPTCKGSGEIECDECEGAGVVEECKGEDCEEVECSQCGGTGVDGCPDCESSGIIECWNCRGDGEIPCEACDGDGEIQCAECEGEGKEPCEECGGSGEWTCTACDGTGYILNYLCTNCNDYPEEGCEYCSKFKSGEPEEFKDPNQLNLFPENKKIFKRFMINKMIRKHFGKYIQEQVNTKEQGEKLSTFTLKVSEEKYLKLYAGFDRSKSQFFLQLKDSNENTICYGNKIFSYLEKIYLR